MTLETVTLNIDLIGKYDILKSTTDTSDGRWILYLHGLPGGPLEELKPYLDLSEKHNFNSIAFNYPGFWQSPGQFSRYDLFAVVNAVLSYLKEQKPKKVFILADSFGGLVAFNIVGKNLFKIDKVVLRAPLTDIRPVGHDLPMTLRYLSTEGILKSDPELIFEHVGEINPPNFFKNTKETKFWGVIGINDEVLPAEEMIKAVKGFKNINIELWDDFPHNMISEELYNKFINKAMKFLND